jgi:hypothetical protein
MTIFHLMICFNFLSHTSIYRKQLYIYIFIIIIIISWACMTQAFHKIISCAIVWDTVHYCSFWELDIRMTSKRRLQAQELILDSDSWRPHIWRWHFSSSLWHWRGWQDRHRLQRLDRHCTVWPSAPVTQVYGGGLRQNEAPNINKDSSPLSVFMFFFLKIMQLLVEETNSY